MFLIIYPFSFCIFDAVLASWFRLKYPHVALGALASSAPILYFDNIVPPEDGYYSIVTKDFRVIYFPFVHPFVLASIFYLIKKTLNYYLLACTRVGSE